MEVVEINKYKENGTYYVTYKFWVKGDCACSATQIKRSFLVDPTKDDLINAI